MKFRNAKPVLLLVAVAIFLPALCYARADFKLKEGAGGKLCLGCHDGVREAMKKSSVHTPLADGECVGCHNPHASNFEMMMASPQETICYTCHGDLIPDEARSIHKVVGEGQCTLCHDPHASQNRSNLLKKGEELCFECHRELGDKIENNKFSHPPVRENCLDCHGAHASADNIKLLNEATPALCLQCHETDGEAFQTIHKGYPVGKADCTTCHDPHGSNQGAMLYDNVHDPVAKGSCGQCHVAPGSTEPFALKASGYETCMACHYEMINDTLNKSHLHWPLADDKNCMNCHTPHASPEKKLMRGTMLAVCGACHADTLARQERSVTEHPPIAEGDCGECHLPHSSDYQFMLKDDSQRNLCGDCHDWRGHTTHPIGDEFADPRNKNRSVECTSCHRTHGTENTHFLHFSTANELCIQCHATFRR